MKAEKINIGIAGFGNIGSYFYKILNENKKSIKIKTGKTLVVKYISAKNFNKKRKIKIPKSKRINNPINLTLKKSKTKKKSIDLNKSTKKLSKSSNEFSELVERINRENTIKPFPDINDIPN